MSSTPCLSLPPPGHHGPHRSSAILRGPSRADAGYVGPDTGCQPFTSSPSFVVDFLRVGAPSDTVTGKRIVGLFDAGLQLAKKDGGRVRAPS